MRGTSGTVAAVVGLVGAFALVGPGQADSGFQNKYENDPQTQTCNEATGDRIDYAGPTKLWPPNHKMQEVSFTATNGVGGPASLEVAVDLLDVAGGDGSPNQGPDQNYPAGPAASGTPSATVPVEIRSERSGKGEGRTYTLTAIAQFNNNPLLSCTMDVEVTVPHDMRGGADWK
jgi:hypothetical protein